MKKYIIKISLFTIMIFIFGIIRNELKSPKNFYNPYLQKKLEFIKNAQQPYNLLFIGSSKVNNQINTPLINSLNPTFNSYNLGANGSFLLESLRTTEYLIEQEDFLVTTIVLEVQDKTKLSKENLKSPRSFSVFNWETLKFSVEYNACENDYHQMVYSVLSYLLNVLYWKNPNTNEPFDAVSDSVFQYHNGFFPLNIDPNKAVIQRHQKLINDTLVIQKREKKFLNDSTSYHTNYYYTKKLQELNSKAKAKGIRLILFVIPPAEPDAKRLEKLVENTDIPIINIISPNKYPEFYEFKNRWDYGHLNEKGANILSADIEPLLQQLINY